MVYAPPLLTEAGFIISSYQETEDFLVSEAKRIFGDDIYLDNDSQDFQDITTRALALYETAKSFQQVFSMLSPRVATGVALAGTVLLNGIKPQPETYSQCTVVVTGTPYTLIEDGVAEDISGNSWNLPAAVTIGAGGTTTVTATAQVPGPIVALAGQINIIQTTTNGWLSVTNPTAATPGTPAEAPASLRSRQAASVANPSQALVEGIRGAILAVPSVLQTAVVYENDTNVAVYTINGVANSGGFPPHSITCVVDGGDGQTIANAIAVRKTPGCYTDGDNSYTTVDSYGEPNTIRFYRPTKVSIDLAITIKALAGYNSSIGDALKAAAAAYINSLGIGQSVVRSQAEYAAIGINTNPDQPFFSLTNMTLNRHGTGFSPGTADLAMNFKEEAVTQIAYITLTVT